LAVHLQLSLQATVDQYCRRVGDKLSLREINRGPFRHDCIFLKEENGKRTCSIYPVRPLQCRTWPFWHGNLDTQKEWDVAAVRCPGMNTGRDYSVREIEGLRDATDWP
jgi:uncharacterized protein